MKNLAKITKHKRRTREICAILKTIHGKQLGQRGAIMADWGWSELGKSRLYECRKKNWGGATTKHRNRYVPMETKNHRYGPVVVGVTM